MVGVSDFDRFVFVVGAPRCGTTTLSDFVKSNPSVASPVVKEPHFFAQNDLRRLSGPNLRARVEREYLRRFFRGDPERRVGIDASVTYLYTPEQLEPILRVWPDSRFVVSLRDPVAMLPSLHRRLIYIGDETIDSFEQAWAAMPDRRAGRSIPRRCADPRWFFYDEAARFATYVERLFEVVGRDRCLVLLFDDLRADPEGEYRRIMKFAGLEPAQGIDLTARRVSYGVRLRWLQRILKRPPNMLMELFAGEKFWERTRNLDSNGPRGASKAVMSLRKRLLEWNRVSRPSERLSATFQNEICRHFRSEVDRLATLLGRDLSHWLRSAD